MMIGLALRMFGIVRSGASAGLAWITASARNILLVALAAALVWGYFGHRKAGKLEKVLAATETGYRDAQAEAKLAQDALNSAILARYRAEAEKSSAIHHNALEGARSAVARYAGANRLRPEADCRPASDTNPAAVPGDSGVDARPGAGPDMVAIAVADLDQLAEGTVRAESCRAWGQSLIDAGLAIAGG